MKMQIKMYAVIAMITLLVGCVSETPMRMHQIWGVPDNGRTSPTSYRVSTWTTALPLRRYNRSINEEDVSGCYVDPLLDSFGFELYFYPDGVFKVVESGDVRPSFVIAEGTWQLMGNILTASIAEEHKGWGDGLSYLRELHGDITKWHIFVTGDGNGIWDTVLLTRETLNKDPGEYRQYLVRHTYYRNWKTERESFKTHEQWKKEQDKRESNKNSEPDGSR